MKTKSESNITRRDFIEAGALAGSAPFVIGLGGNAFAGQASNEIRCAIIGTGGRGRDAHIKSILNIPGVRITAICDISQEALEKALAMFPGEKPKTYTYYREMLEKENLDAATVATPPQCHRSQMIEVLQKNLHLYAEKPLVLTVNDMNELEQVAKKSKGIMQVGQQGRYSDTNRKMIEMIRAGEIGRIGYIHAQRFSKWGGPGAEEQKMRWLWSIEESGDQLVEQSIHNIDQINWILDSHPIKATGLGGQNVVYEPVGRDTSDHFAVIYEYPGKVHVTFTMIKYGAYDFDGSFTRVYAEKGACEWGRGQFIKRGKDANPYGFEAGRGDTTQQALNEFFRCIREGKKPYADVEIGKTALLTTMLGRKAFFEERVVTWEQLLKEDASIKRISDDKFGPIA